MKRRRRTRPTRLRLPKTLTEDQAAAMLDTSESEDGPCDSVIAESEAGQHHSEIGEPTGVPTEPLQNRADSRQFLARNQAILELLYGCGLRSCEIVRLRRHDVNPEYLQHNSHCAVRVLPVHCT